MEKETAEAVSFYLERRGNILVMAIAGLLLMLGWLVPNHYYPWSMFYNDWLAWLGLIIFSAELCRGKASLRAPRVVFFLGSIALIPVLQWAGGIIFFLGDALLASLYLAGFAVAAFLAFNVAKHTKFTDQFAWLFVFGSLISFFLALHQWLGLDTLGIWLVEMPLGGRPYANLAQPNNLASLLCLGVVACLYLHGRGLVGRVFLIFVGVLLCIGIAMTRSRMALFVILMLVAWLFFCIGRLSLRYSRLETLVGGAIPLGFWLAWPSISEFLYLSADSSLARLEGAASGEVRWVIWRQLLDAVFNGPWLGYGWNQVSVAQMAVAAEYPTSVFTEHAHNLGVDLLCWNGLLIGAILILCGVWWLFTSLVRTSDLTGWFGMAVILVLLTHSLFEFPLDYAIFLIPFGLCVGLVESSYGGTSLLLPKKLLVGVTIAGVVISIWVFVEYLSVQADYNRLRYESVGIVPREMGHVVPDIVLLTQSREFLRFARTQARTGMSPEEIEFMHQVAFRYAFPPVMFRYALALGLNGQYDAAATQLMRLRQLHSEARFSEAKDGWRVMQESNPDLAKVKLPE